ncbi:putative disease resistance protein At4g11170 isoform X3 [Vigna unguiculata]|uniref:putative disease resistance protein At4g11170 isoform X3 n=1 Tax=Vigna unguiculata TaxID=3917 RepID=UPI001015EAC7|nr:putative disease resistance protein At4g11170 isoform X3 [Vigna unguiculata]
MASSIPSMEFASSSSKRQRRYDVLINFSGEDIRKKFVSHLDSALSAVGLTTIHHHHNAVHIQQPILKLCRVAIVVFTQTYSESAWCLHQLQQIIQWHETYCQHVLPVYYEIRPSDVRLQKGNFGETLKATAQQAFSGQQLEHGMSMWNLALTKAANLFGWDDSNYRSDAEVVDNIVKTVLHLPALSATKFPVGLQSHMEDLIQTIKNKSSEVCIIGIYGGGGLGKTTLAKAIYHQIHGTFKEKCFIEDVAQVSKIRGHAHLQEQLLSNVLKTKVEIHSVEMGGRMIRESLSGKRVLIVLDDMNEYSTLLDLCRCRARFSEGTVIIITTTNEGLLIRHPVDSVFRIERMNAKESLELLSWHAFREAKPKEDYNDLARKVVTYSGELPLLLEVTGSSLFERTKREWNGVLFEFAKRPQNNVPRKLKISFDVLCNQIEKDLFLDVCRFFVGKGRVYATNILNGFGVDVDNGIRVLTERSLIQVEKNNKLGMHSLLREMGREIIREITGKEPGKISQLWLDKDVEYVLTENTVLASSESYDISLPVVNDPYCLVHMGEGHSIFFTVPRDLEMKGMTLCVVYLSTPMIFEPEVSTISIVNYTKCTCQIHKHDPIISFNDEDWHRIVSNLGSGDKVEIFVSFSHRLVVKNTIVYLICGESNNLEKEPEQMKNYLSKFIRKL